MTDLILIIVTFVVGIGVGLYLGFAVGERLADKSAGAFWLANGAFLLCGLLGGMLAGALRWNWLWGFAMALVGGGLTGLKYGYGKSVGIWRIFDRLMGLDPDHRE